MALALLAAGVAALALAGQAAAGGPALSIGVVEDGVKRPTLAATAARLALVRRAGFDAIEVTQTWTLGEEAPPAWQARELRYVYAAARPLGMHVILGVYPSGSSQTPLAEQAVAQFAVFAARLVRSLGARELVVGNEPNLNRFWLPQFGPDGTDVAAPAYLDLLARTYDAVEAVDPAVVVDGGALAAHGADRPGGVRPTHSPTAFITDLGDAYRASGRRRPVMGAFDMHPYEASSAISPAATDPRSTTIAIADYGKLVALLGRAFDGTAQPGSTLPIVYGEFGVETGIPPAKAPLYTGAQPASARTVDPATQGRYYREAIALAFCQPNVRTLLLLHAFDEPALAGWQSGVYYADGTPKPSLPIVRAAIGAARRGIIARCAGLELTPGASRLVWPHGALRAGRPVRLALACSIDCTYRIGLERVPSGRVVAARSGRLPGRALRHLLVVPKARAGRYRLRLILEARVDRGPPRTLAGPVFAIRPAAGRAR